MDYPFRDIPVCEICQKPASQTCGGCKIVYYCSKAHQKLGWREGHKFKCCAFKVQFSDSLGRHMVATRDIKQGEMILKEKPAVLGPRMSAPPHCLGCNRKLQPQKTAEIFDYYKCSSCKWPMCGPKCEKSDNHKVECKLMTDRKYKCNISYDSEVKCEAAYCVITPVRILLMKDSNPLQYENIMNLQSHLEQRMSTKLYTILKANLVTFVVQVLGLKFDEETILKAASVLDTNAFDVRSPDGTQRFRAIYVTASMMNHSCRCNTRHIFLGDDFSFALIATVPIPKGEQITVTYTQSLFGTLDRRRHLKTNKYFDCECSRCKDPTEFGTYLGNIYCSVCNGPGSEYGVSRGAMMVSTNPLDDTSSWKCEKCDHTLLSKQMVWGNNALKQDLSKLDKSIPREFEEFIDKYRQTLHPNNHLVVQAKLSLVQIYGNIKGYYLSELSDALLQRKLNLCQELLDIADVLETGWSRFRGTLLLDYQAALAMQAKRDFEAGKLTKTGAQENLMESMALLKEASNILAVEPHMREIIENKIKELNSYLEDPLPNNQATDPNEID